MTQEEKHLLKYEMEGEQAITDLETNIDELNNISIQKENSRFSGAKWIEITSHLNVLVLGVGGIGSWASLLVSRLSIKKITLIDPDIVTQSNMSGQLYPFHSVNEKKVEVLRMLLTNFAYDDLEINVEDEIPNSLQETEYCKDPDIIICGLDNMNSRKNYFKLFKKMKSDKEVLFIDGRLTPENFQVFAFTNKQKEQMDMYEKYYLFDSSEAEETVCSYKQTSYLAAMIGSVIANIIVNWSYNQITEFPGVEIPFLTAYNSIVMNLETFNVEEIEQ